MKKFLFTLVLLMGIFLMACQPSDSLQSEITDQYFASTTLFECKIVSLRKPTYQDSSRFTTDCYYVLAKDVWDAQRLFEDKLTDLRNTLNGAEVYWNPIPIAMKQTYPYICEP